ncbi:AAA family ATPase [Oceanobacillus sp. CAU 1775]
MRASIFGFGKLVDYSLDFPQEGPVIIYGENESGKSTFHQFILFMLFGMPPRLRKFYQPKTSSKFGGQLVLFDSEIGEFTIERTDNKNNGAATCFTNTGEVYDESWLKDRLHQMDQKTFQAIFSFSALDLNAIKDMDEENLGEVLLSIGLTGSSSIYQVEKQLDDRLAELFRPAAKNRIINRQLQVLDELAEQLTAYKMSEASYREKVMEIESITKTLKSFQMEKQEKVKQNNFITKQRTTLPVIQEYQQLNLKQEQFQQESSFPENGIMRLEKVKEELRPLESEYTILENNAVKVKDNLATLNKELLEEQHIEKVSSMIMEIENSFSMQDKFLKLQDEQAAIKAKIEDELHDLQLNIEEVDLESLSLPFYIEETWKQLKVDKEQLGQEKNQLEEAFNGLREEKRYYDTALQEAKRNLLMEEHINEIRQKLDQNREHEQLQRLHEATVLKQNKFKKEKEVKNKRSKNILFGSFILLALFVGLALIVDNNLFYAIAIFFIVLGIGQYFANKQNIKQMDDMLQSPILFKEHEQLTETERIELERQLKLHEEKVSEVERISTTIQEQIVKEIKLEEKERIFREKLQRHQQQVEEQITIYPFLRDKNVSYWSDYYQRLKELAKSQQIYTQLAAEISDLQKEVNKIDIEVNQSMEELYPAIEHMDLTSTLQFLKQLLTKNDELKHNISLRKESLKEIKIDSENLLKRMSVYKNEIVALLKVAQADTEEAFYELARYTEEKRELEAALELNKQQLDKAFPHNAWSLFINEHLDDLELQQAQDQLEKEITELDYFIEEKRSRFAEVNYERDQLESSDAYSAKMHQFEMEKEKLNQLGREWAILKTEKEVLSDTKQKYRAKYLTKVMEETTHFLEKITNGNYVAVNAPENKETFWVVSEDGIRYDVNELSQGTMNQLYVALRLAISNVMTEAHALPFILDDAFVHFDEGRNRKMIEILQQIATSQQMIIFTCRNDVRDTGEALKIATIEL